MSDNTKPTPVSASSHLSRLWAWWEDFTHDQARALNAFNHLLTVLQVVWSGLRGLLFILKWGFQLFKWLAPFLLALHC